MIYILHMKNLKFTEFKGEGVGGGSGLGTCVHPWRIHVDAWQNQCNIVISL